MNKGRNLDLTSDVPSPSSPKAADKTEAGAQVRSTSTQPKKQNFIGLRFACCDCYQRVYIKPDTDRFVARCPKCSKSVTFRVGPDGTDARFFTVS